MALDLDQSSFQDDDDVIYYDITTITGSEALINGALFFSEQPTSSSGTGLIQAFVRVQDGGNDDTPGFENGYNTDFRPLSYEENTSPSFTTTLSLADVPVVTIDGVDYYEFRLDINQLNSSPLLSLDAIKLYKSDVTDGDANGEIDDVGGWFDLNATLVYDLDYDIFNTNSDGDNNQNTDNSVLLDYSLQAGSGKSDMFFYVPVSNFGGADPETTNVTLYSEFGAADVLDSSDGLSALDDSQFASNDESDDDPTSVYGTYTSNDGFEEWSVSKTLGESFISGYKWDDVDGDGIWDTGEQALEGWKFHYEYTTGNGQNVITHSGDAITDANGQYFIPVVGNNHDYTITITEVSAPGSTDLGDWINTYDGDGTLDATTYVTIDKDLVDLPQGDFETTEQLNFGNFELYDISGTKYEDITGDGITGDDGTLSGVTIFIDMDNSSDLSAGDLTTTTDASGNWSFTDLDASHAGKTVYEVLPGGYVQTVGQAGYGITGTSGADQSGLDFANFELMNLSGYKWGDIDGDGTWDEPDGAGLEGWTIVIDFDDNPDNGFFASTTTNSAGYYEFTNLGPDTLGDDGSTKLSDDADGTLYVYEIQQNGFTQTYNGGYTFSITSGLVVSGAIGVAEEGNFGNQMMLGANRTPGFWQSTLGYSLYDGDDDNNGDANGDGVPDGDKNFDEEGWSTTDLLTKYGTDTDSDGENDTFILWDENNDGLYDPGDDIFLTPEQLHDWVSGGPADEKGSRDYTEALERDLGATFLNTLNNHSLTTPGSDSEDPHTGQDTVDGEIWDSYTAAVEFILKHDADLDGEADVGKKGQQHDWKDGEFGVDDISGSDAHTELAGFNENGEAMMGTTMTQILMDGDDYSSELVQNYLGMQDSLFFQGGLLGITTTNIDDDMMLAQKMLAV